MTHHKTNTLRLEFLLGELRGLLHDMEAHAEATVDKNPNSHTGRILTNEAKNFESFLLRTLNKMYLLMWAETEDPTPGI